MPPGNYLFLFFAVQSKTAADICIYIYIYIYIYGTETDTFKPRCPYQWMGAIVWSCEFVADICVFMACRKHKENQKNQKIQASCGEKPKKHCEKPKKTKKPKILGTMPTISSKLSFIVSESFGFFGFFGFSNGFCCVFLHGLWIFWFFWFSLCFWRAIKIQVFVYLGGFNSCPYYP